MTLILKQMFNQHSLHFDENNPSNQDLFLYLQYALNPQILM